MNSAVVIGAMVEVVVVEVVVVVVVEVLSVIVTSPGCSGFLPSHPRHTAPTSAESRSLRNTITDQLERQIESNDWNEVRVETGVFERRQHVQREQQVAFQIRLQTRDERDFLNAFRQCHGRVERRHAGRVRWRDCRLKTDLAPTQYVSPQQIDNQREFRRGLVLNATRVLNLMSCGDRGRVLFKVRYHIHTVAPELESAVDMRPNPSLPAGENE